MQTLADLLGEARQAGSREALRYFNGYREWSLNYEELLRKIGGFASCLDSAGLTSGDRLVIWGENRIEWVIAFWGAVARGIQVVPIDVGFSPQFARKITELTSPRLVIHSSSVDPSVLKLDSLSFSALERLEGTELSLSPARPEDVVEIVFTSGTTGNPKGVVLRHQNLCANLRPFQSEIERYRIWLSLIQPFRVLNLLPLSHLFGQTLGLFIPLLLRSACLFVNERSPEQLVNVIRRKRVAVLVSVPLIAEQLQDFFIRRHQPRTEGYRARGIVGVAERWWKNRSLHRALGWRFWAFVLGGAPVPLSLERFWRGVGVATIQGYGLTEASPIVAVNHPFHSRVGALGKALEGQEVRISEEGEILVRGPGVVRDFISGEPAGDVVEGDGWLHTGDLGAIDPNGNLVFKGRMADRIVLPDGMNVYPEEVEAILEEVPGVRECAVVGKLVNRRVVIHAVLVTEREDEPLAGLVQQANRNLEEHQRIHSWSRWPEERLPRTPSTMKLQRNVVREGILSDSLEGSVKAALGRAALPETFDELVGSRQSGIAETTRLQEDLGLTSLDRVDLHAALEGAGLANIPESSIAELETVGDLRRLMSEAAAPDAPVQQQTGSEGGRGKEISFPRWTRSLPVRSIRGGVRRFLALPLFRHYIGFLLTGIQHLDGIHPPVLFVANHTSHLDVLAILSGLPVDWQWRIAPAMRLERFSSFLLESRSLITRVGEGLEYVLACALFNAFPLPQQAAVLRRSVQYAGELVAEGYCPLVFPEGRRSEDGAIGGFRPGVALLAQKLEVPVIPLYLRGVLAVLPPGSRWPKRGNVELAIGRPLHPGGRGGYEEFSLEIENAVRELARQNR